MSLENLKENETNNEPVVEKAPVKETDEKAAEDMDEDDVKDDNSEAEEEALFEKLEHDEEEKEAKELHEQPKDVKAAPKLLQSGLEQGLVKPDESESEDDKKDPAYEAKAAETKEQHHHARVSWQPIDGYLLRNKVCEEYTHTFNFNFCFFLTFKGGTTGLSPFQGIRIL